MESVAADSVGADSPAAQPVSATSATDTAATVLNRWLSFFEYDILFSFFAYGCIPNLDNSSVLSGASPG